MDNWQPVLALVGALLIAYVVILWLGTIVWVYRDVRQRTHDSWTHNISLALPVLFNLPGLILYLILRPRETLLEVYERRLETEALMSEMPERRACQRCNRPVKEDFLLCPHCRTVLRESCSGCGKLLELGWAACPYCGAQGPQPLVAATPVMAPSSYAAAVPPPPSPTQATPPEQVR
jgi:RNA polymerase subunit RPABC4/transcription elongation factor Spt4